MFEQDILQSIFPNQNIRTFPGTRPTTITTKHLPSLAFGYTATLPVMGTRAFLFVTAQTWRLVFEDLQVLQISQWPTTTQLYVFDVNMVTDDIFITDTLVANGQSVLRFCHTQRIESAKAFMAQLTGSVLRPTLPFTCPSRFGDYSILRGEKTIQVQTTYIVQYAINLLRDHICFTKQKSAYQPFQNDNVLVWTTLTIVFRISLPVPLSPTGLPTVYSEDTIGNITLVTSDGLYVARSQLPSYPPTQFGHLVEFVWRGQWVVSRLRPDAIGPISLYVLQTMIDTTLSKDRILDVI